MGVGTPETWSMVWRLALTCSTASCPPATRATVTCSHALATRACAMPRTSRRPAPRGRNLHLLHLPNLQPRLPAPPDRCGEQLGSHADQHPQPALLPEPDEGSAPGAGRRSLCPVPSAVRSRPRSRRVIAAPAVSQGRQAHRFTKRPTAPHDHPDAQHAIGHGMCDHRPTASPFACTTTRHRLARHNRNSSQSGPK